MIIDLRSGETVQEELLVRMQRGENPDEVVMPADFLPQAERFGLIGQIDRYMVHRVASAGGAIPRDRHLVRARDGCQPRRSEGRQEHRQVGPRLWPTLRPKGWRTSRPCNYSANSAMPALSPPWDRAGVSTQGGSACCPLGCPKRFWAARARARRMTKPAAGAGFATAGARFVPQSDALIVQQYRLAE